MGYTLVETLDEGRFRATMIKKRNKKKQDDRHEERFEDKT